jgi:hypothetical protein
LQLHKFTTTLMVILILASYKKPADVADGVYLNTELVRANGAAKNSSTLSDGEGGLMER